MHFTIIIISIMTIIITPMMSANFIMLVGGLRPAALHSNYL